MRLSRWLLLIVLLMSLALAATWQQLQAVQLGYEIEKAEVELRDLQRELHHLEAEVSELSSPGQLLRRARALGLRLAEPERARVLYGDPAGLDRLAGREAACDDQAARGGEGR